MRILAIDHGDRRFGLAITDPDGVIALPLDVVHGEDALLEMLPELIADREVERILVGMPLNMDGTVGPRARKVVAFCERLGDLLGLPVVTWDERLTTFQAEEMLRETGGSPRKRRERVDAVAAQVLLQSWVDAGMPGGTPEDR